MAAKKAVSKSAVKSSDPIEVVISFDTTGSMYPCLTQVRRAVSDLVQRLFDDLPNLRIGVIAHGDYCDGPRAITKLDLTTSVKSLCTFIKDVPATNGGDAPECYELALRTGREMAWSPKATKVLVVIGDELPHGKSEGQNKDKIDWREEVKLLGKDGIKVYGVQALGNAHAEKFYETISEETGGFHLQLDQFANIVDTILAVAYKQQGNERLQQFEAEVKKEGRMSRSVLRSFDKMLGRKSAPASAKSLDSVPAWRFQVLKVDRDISIADFVEENGLVFQIGRGFYQFTKSVKVQSHKEVILREKATGDMYTGPQARKMAGIPEGREVTVSPEGLGGYDCFIQSTSSNRKLLKGTYFLYET